MVSLSALFTCTKVTPSFQNFMVKWLLQYKNKHVSVILQGIETNIPPGRLYDESLLVGPA